MMRMRESQGSKGREVMWVAIFERSGKYNVDLKARLHFVFACSRRSCRTARNCVSHCASAHCASIPIAIFAVGNATQPSLYTLYGCRRV